MTRSKIQCALWALAAGCGLATPAAAQVPAATFAHPAGGQVGTKATVNIGGANLQGATQVLISGQGVTATVGVNTNAASLPIELDIAPDAQPGMREIRVVTPRGTSNAERVWIGPYAEGMEVEPNNALTAAQKLDKLPISVNGQINGGEDVDFYTFQANAGDTYVFDLVAFRVASGLDGYLAVYDARGKILKSQLEAFDRDPRIIYTFKTAGTYSVGVRDTMFRGGADFVYKLTLGKIPVVTGYMPSGGKRGQMVNVTLEGANLGDMKSMAVQIPMEGDAVSVVPNTPMGMAASPISLYASDLNETVEAEPNDTAAQATPVPDGPVVVNGRIDKAREVDLYRVKPSAAGNLSFEVWGRRLGSRIDSFLRVLDATGKELQANDDAAGKDSRIVMAVAANTEYLVEVRTIDPRYGGDVFYRLAIEPPAGQDFTLTMTPDSINVGQGNSAAVTVTVNRMNGFTGPVALRVEGLPAGVTASPAVIPAGAANAQFTVTAAADAAAGAVSQIKVIGTGTLGMATAERVAQGIESFKPPLAQDNQIQTRQTLITPATVMPEQAYSLDIEPRAITVKKGTMNVEIKVKATRQAAATQEIKLTIAGQPANVTPVPANIAASGGEIIIKLNIAANAPTVTQNLIITGNLNNNVQVAPALTLTITD